MVEVDIKIREIEEEMAVPLQANIKDILIRGVTVSHPVAVDIKPSDDDVQSNARKVGSFCTCCT
ncbi:MAG TPA: hypothetical protein VE971_00130 [Candidatus Eisenbacteria bacterium]|nr:hypothetical protein [Candidatus Eisenbacteria bacterium]